MTEHLMMWYYWLGSALYVISDEKKIWTANIYLLDYIGHDYFKEAGVPDASREKAAQLRVFHFLTRETGW